ncbi:MAG: cysteine peptidase family C39 domain-containing protein, partial [Oscillospiraceae bacterium]|nr:cysteine peptidase family C39 domain-containing protein [Oscillospiraceae bacterium]
MRLSRYHCIRQYDMTDCGAACLATVSKQYGLKIPITRIREVAGTDTKGTNIYGVIKAAEQLGFTAKGLKSFEQESEDITGKMRKALLSNFTLPAIAHTVVEGVGFHYVVIHRITKKQIIIADPGKGLRKLTADEFLKEWTGVL